jgi:Hemerythrin HHE cation binding domain
MTNHARDDLFTSIHKALRLGIFTLTAQAGNTDWGSPAEVAELYGKWLPLLDLLRAHTAHEDGHILRLLDQVDPRAAEPAAEQHGDLEDLLEEIDQQFEALVKHPEPAAGLRLYRDLARFVAGYLPHLHDEETRIMSRIWDCCTDEEIAAAREGFMAETTPEQLATTLEYMLPALDRVTRRQLVEGLAGSAPPPVVNMVFGVAERVLPATAYQELRAPAA